MAASTSYSSFCGRKILRMKNNANLGVAVLALCCLATLTGCAGNNPVDPYENVNRFFYNFNSGLDRYALKPLSDGYVKIIPPFIRTSLGNGFDNLGYFNVVFNDLLQGKTGQGLGDFGRMAVNSVVGIGGLFDPATGWGLPSHDNRFGDTLGRWGYGAGPYLVLPLFGPSCLRDAPGIGVAAITDPVFWLFPPWYVTVPLSAVGTIDARSRSDFLVKFRDEAAIDPYVFTRQAYLQYRENQIHEGRPTTQEGFYDEDTGDSGK
jgi:phospholipid-binding lipoprotein MlaA